MMELDLAGRTVTSCDFGYTVTIRFAGGRELDIESDLLLARPDRRVELSPGVEVSEGAEMLSELISLTVTSAMTEESGELRLKFEEGTMLSIEPDEEFESWTYVAPDGLKIVCMPGGELAVWSEERGR
ncbi:DUF6188 family protein [Saccharomonospora xinjiangensis]|uniref:DUF6188 family protein n=1 Tax=Saccharomonospora xinjiangensis TaxID=75294 RepID=UPI00350FE981